MATSNPSFVDTCSDNNKIAFCLINGIELIHSIRGSNDIYALVISEKNSDLKSRPVY